MHSLNKTQHPAKCFTQAVKPDRSHFINSHPVEWFVSSCFPDVIHELFLWSTAMARVYNRSILAFLGNKFPTVDWVNIP